MLITLITIITLVATILALSGKPLAHIDSAMQAQALIEQHDQNTSDDPDRQAEKEARLYHELKAVLRHQTTTYTRLPLITIPIILLTISVALAFWYTHNGKDALRWESLSNALKSQIKQTQVYGAEHYENPAFLKQINTNIATSGFFNTQKAGNNQLLYCQALQRTLDRTDPIQLDALGKCYAELSLYELAEPVFDRLITLQPDDSRTILEWAQAKTLARPNQAVPQEVETKLQQLTQKEPHNILARLFLASSYQQKGQATQAAPLWESLLQDIPKTDPLYPAIEQAALANAQTRPTTNTSHPNQFNITVHIPSQTLTTMGNNARLFILATEPNQRMPIAVKALPPATTITTTLTDQDTMTGGKLSDHPNLIIRAKLSPSGNAMDTESLEVQGTATDGQLTLTIP